MGLLHKDLKGSFFQCFSVFIRQCSIASFDKIMVEGSVGVLWRADGHNGEVKVVDGVGGDRGGNRMQLPILVRLGNEDSSRDEPKTNDKKPNNLC